MLSSFLGVIMLLRTYYSAATDWKHTAFEQLDWSILHLKMWTLEASGSLEPRRSTLKDGFEEEEKEVDEATQVDGTY